MAGNKEQGVVGRGLVRELAETLKDFDKETEGDLRLTLYHVQCGMNDLTDKQVMSLAEFNAQIAPQLRKMRATVCSALTEIDSLSKDTERRLKQQEEERAQAPAV